MLTTLLIKSATAAVLFPALATGFTPAQEPAEPQAADASVTPISAEAVFGKRFKNVESMSTGEWWKVKPSPRRTMSLDVPRSEVVAFAVYTHDRGTLKLTAQLFPLYPKEQRTVRLELRRGDGDWSVVATEAVVDLGWSAHFRIEDWDNTQDVSYRVRHGEEATFEGLIRKDPIEKDTIVVGNLSCNSARTPGSRATISDNLKRIDPDLLFFAGDQSYHHREHTYGWLEFGVQFRDVLRDRPVITIPDDHDIGQSNLWGESGKQATDEQGPSGGYFFPAAYVNMVERCQTWHLPDPFDPEPVERDIGTYFTSLNVGASTLRSSRIASSRAGPRARSRRWGRARTTSLIPSTTARRWIFRRWSSSAIVRFSSFVNGVRTGPVQR